MALIPSLLLNQGIRRETKPLYKIETNFIWNFTKKKDLKENLYYSDNGSSTNNLDGWNISLNLIFWENINKEK